MPALESSRALLEVRDLSVTYGGAGDPRPVISNVNFDIAAGEVLGIQGPSGCGKTTIALALLKLLPSSAAAGGSVRYDGRQLLKLSEAELRRIRGREIAIVYQEPSLALNPVMRVGDQIAEVLRAHQSLSATERKEHVEHMLAQIDLDPKRYYGTYPHELSGGERHRIVLAQALICQPSLVIADEPTAGLNVELKHDILNLIENLHQQLGTAFLIISHDRDVMNRFAERVLDLPLMSGNAQAIQRTYLRPVTRRKTACAGERKLVFEARNLVKSYEARGLFKRRQAEQLALDGVDLTVFSGEIVAVVGASGSGKSTLARCLALLESSDSGELFVDGKDLLKLHERERRQYRPWLQYIAQDAAEALNPRFTARQAVEEPLLIQGVDRVQRHKQVAATLERVGLEPATGNRPCQEFSGGQKQRLVIARALTLQPRLLIFDESLSGLDPETQSGIANLMMRLRSELGIAQILISHDVNLVSDTADRVVVMRNGRLTESAAGDQASADTAHRAAERTVTSDSQPDPVMAEAK